MRVTLSKNIAMDQGGGTVKINKEICWKKPTAANLVQNFECSSSGMNLTSNFKNPLGYLLEGEVRHFYTESR